MEGPPPAAAAASALTPPAPRLFPSTSPTSPFLLQTLEFLCLHDKAPLVSCHLVYVAKVPLLHPSAGHGSLVLSAKQPAFWGHSF